MSGLGSFIEGAFRGYEFGERTKDRKRNREWQDQTREWAKEDRDWKREDRDYMESRREVLDARQDADWRYTQGQRARKTREQDQNWKDKQEERDFFQDLYSNTKEQYEQSNPPPGIIETLPKEKQPGNPDAPQPGNPDAPQPGIAGQQPPQRDTPAPRPQKRSRHDPAQLEAGKRIIMRSLETGIDPTTNQPLTPEKRKEYEGYVNVWSRQNETGAQSTPNITSDAQGSPSIEAATQTAPQEGRGVLGKKDVVKATPQQRERAANDFMNYYTQEAVPKIFDFYAKRGDLNKAEAFKSWYETEQAQAQARSWSKAVHAAQIGDEDAFLDNMADSYDAFDNGYEVVRDQSGFTYDQNNNITGGRVAFKNTKTGKVHVETFDDQEDILRAGINAMAPEKVFEYLYGQVEQAGKIAADQRQHERKIELEHVKRGLDGPKNDAKLIADAKKALAEEMGFDWGRLSADEQDRLAIERVRRDRAAATSLSLPEDPPPYTGQ